MSRPRIHHGHGFRTYDDWKLATPPEYDELGPEPCECEGRGCPECDPEPEPEGEDAHEPHQGGLERR
jgi:hypothetical protein